MSIKTISLERLQEIETERLQTQMDPNYRRWVKQLNVSKSYINRHGITQANQIMKDWDINKLFKMVSHN